MNETFPVSPAVDASILAADDDLIVRETIFDILSKDNYTITLYDPSSGDGSIYRKQYDVVILDIFMPDTDGFKLREEVMKCSPYAQFIIITGQPDPVLLDKILDLGVYGFLIKPFSSEQLRYSVMGALRMSKLLKKNREHEVIDGTKEKGLIGRSPIITEVRRRISEVAPLDIPVMITGESGTGKEIAARCIHAFSKRAENRFTAVNCAGLPLGLIETELFGHAQGAFTGAVKAKRGYFEVADHGTLFLDEIGDLPLELQSRLLRVLDSGEYSRVGDTRLMRADVRIVCATNRDLAAMTEEGAFRKDLYYRLKGARIDLPPLKDRTEDIPLLVRHFLADEGYAVANDAMKALTEHQWPGNIRQLKMVVLNVKGISSNNLITLGNVVHVLGNDREGKSDRELPTYKEFKNRVLASGEKEYFVELLERHAGNVARAARAAGMDRKNFYEKLKRFGISYSPS